MASHILPDPNACLFYANVENGYVIQHLIAAMIQMKPEKGMMRWSISPLGIHTQTKISVRRPAPNSRNPRDEIFTDGALMNSYLMSKDFNRFECKGDISLEMNAKNLNEQVKTLKRKERIIMYILNKKPYEELTIFSESNVPQTEANSRATTLSVIKVTVLEGHVYGQDVDCLEHKYEYVDATGKVVDQKHAVDRRCTDIYGPGVSLQNYDRVKKLGAKGQLELVVQGADYVSFSVHNRQISQRSATQGLRDPNRPVYTGTFDMEYFAAIATLAKIKKPIKIYAPLIPNQPLKIEVSLESLGESVMYIKDMQLIQRELDIATTLAKR